MRSFGFFFRNWSGVERELSSNFVLYGDVTYLRHFRKVAFSGMIFSGGLRYRF